LLEINKKQMMKKITLLAMALFTSTLMFGQYYFSPPIPGNPNGYNTPADAEQPVVAGSTPILAQSATPTWSPVQTLPFPFQFNGAAETSFKVSSTGVLTFSTAVTAVPTSTPAALPSSSIPDKSAMVWGIEGVGTNDAIATKVYGTAPKRQLWVMFLSFSVRGATAGSSNWSYYSIVLEEGSNGIYFVDQRINAGNGTDAITMGIQANATTAYQIASSPNLAHASTDIPDESDNQHYIFLPGVQSSYDVAAASIELRDIEQISPLTIESNFRNFGSTTITGLTMNYQVNGGAVVSSPSGSMNLSSFQTSKVTAAAAWTPTTSGQYTIKVWADALNGSNPDEYNLNDTVTKVVSIVDRIAVRKPLYETFTSSTCPPCVPANTNMEALFATNKGKQSSVKYQMSWPGAGDPYFTLEGQDRRTYYGVSSVPNVAIDGGWNSNGNSLTQQIMNDFGAIPAFVEMTASHSVTGNKVSVTVNADFISAFTSPQNTLHVAIVERKTTQNVGTNGETEFASVMKKMLPNASGTVIGAQVSGMQSWTMDYTFNGNFRLPNNASDPINHAIEHSIEDFNNLGVVAWIQDDATGEVFQSANDMEYISIDENVGSVNFSVFPNPANDFVNIRFNEFNANVSIELINALGQVVYSEVIEKTTSGESAELNTSNLKPGIYVVKIASEGKLASKKLIIE
jgi:hypothetical protein